MQAETKYALHIVTTYEEVTERIEKIITDFGRELQEYGYAINTYENLVRKTVTPGPDFKSSQSYKKLWLYILNSPVGKKSILARFRNSKREDAIILVGDGADISDIASGIPAVEWNENNLAQTAARVQNIILNFSIEQSEGSNFVILKQGSHGDLVLQLKELLRKTVAPNIVLNTIFEESTREAVKSFQREKGLDITGKVDEETFKQLEEYARNSKKEKSINYNANNQQKWIIKIKPKKVAQQEFSKGLSVWKSTEKVDDTEYKLYRTIKPNDIVLWCNPLNTFEIPGMFIVKADVHNDKNLGEGISLAFEKKFDPAITLTKIKGVISGTTFFEPDSENDLLSITEEQFNSILQFETETSKDESEVTLNSYFTTSRFSIRDGSEPVLGVTEIAREVAELIRNLKTKEYGRMVGIFGNWGRGKTFMVEQVWKAIEAEKNNPFIRVNFHAWKYQDTHASWAYLYEAFAKKYFSKPKDKNAVAHFFSDFGRRFNLNLLRHGFWPLVRIGISVGAVFLFAWLAMHKTEIDQLEKAFWYLLTTAGIADSVRLVSRFFREHKIKEKATEVFKVYFEKPSFKDLLGVQSEIQNELRSLLKCWIKEKNGEPEKQILLFVDDIDRCSEERIVQIIDALRVMLEDEEISKRVVVVAAIDERVLRRAIKWKYKELLDADRDLNADENGKNDKWLRTTLHITSEYMDKLFLAGIKLGTLTANEREEIYRQFSKGRVEVIKQTASTEKQDISEAQSQKTNNVPDQKIGSNKPVSKESRIVHTPENVVPVEQIVLKKPFDLGKTDNTQMNTSTLQKQTLSYDKSFELSNEEDIFLNSLVRNLHDVTPRQIRIFYYRYILARNLLTVGLTNSKQQDTFETNQRNELLGLMLAHYTTLRSNEQLLRDRMLYNELTDKNVEGLSIRELVAGHPDNLVTEILEALEMVIAY